MIFDIFASLAFYVVPFLTGRLFTKKIPYAFAIGALFWFAAFFIVSEISSYFGVSFALVIKVLAFCICLVSFINFSLSFRLRWILKQKGVFLLAAFSFSVYFFVWKNLTPYPFALNWDIYEHITLANAISNGTFSFFTSRLSDTFTFNSYPPLFHVLLALPKILFNRNLLGVYYWLEYWHYLLTILVSYLLAKRMFTKQWVILFAGFFAGLVFESQVVYASLFLLPQTLAALLTVFILTEIMKEEKISKIQLFLSAVVLLLDHYIIGFLGCGVIACFLFIRLRSVYSRQFKIAIILSIIVFSISPLLHLAGGFMLISREEAKHFIFTFGEKIKLLFDWYGLLLPVLFPLGVLCIWKENNRVSRLLLCLCLLLFGVSVAPFSYLLKIFVLTHYFVTIVVAAGVAFLVQKTTLSARVVSLILILLALFIVFYKNQTLYKEPLYFKGKQSHISQQELEASSYLSLHAPSHSLLVSDPATQYVLEALSGINSQGGAFMDEDTRQAVIHINGIFDLLQVKKILSTIEDKVPGERYDSILLVLSGRYFAWQNFSTDWKMSTFYNVWAPRTLSVDDKEYIDYFKKGQTVDIFYQNDEMVIIKL